MTETRIQTECRAGHLTARDLSKYMKDVLRRVSEDGERLEITKHGHPTAAIIPLKDLRKLERLEKESP